MFSFLNSMFRVPSSSGQSSLASAPAPIAVHSRSSSENSDDWTLLNASPSASPDLSPKYSPALPAVLTPWRASFADIVRKNASLSPLQSANRADICYGEDVTHSETDATSEDDSDFDASDADEAMLDQVQETENDDPDSEDDLMWDRFAADRYACVFKYDNEFSVFDGIMGNASRGGRSNIRVNPVAINNHAARNYLKSLQQRKALKLAGKADCQRVVAEYQQQFPSASPFQWTVEPRAEWLRRNAGFQFTNPELGHKEKHRVSPSPIAPIADEYKVTAYNLDERNFPSYTPPYHNPHLSRFYSLLHSFSYEFEWRFWDFHRDTILEQLAGLNALINAEAIKHFRTPVYSRWFRQFAHLSQNPKLPSLGFTAVPRALCHQLQSTGFPPHQPLTFSKRLVDAVRDPERYVILVAAVEEYHFVSEYDTIRDPEVISNGAMMTVINPERVLPIVQIEYSRAKQHIHTEMAATSSAVCSSDPVHAESAMTAASVTRAVRRDHRARGKKLRQKLIHVARDQKERGKKGGTE